MQDITQIKERLIEKRMLYKQSVAEAASAKVKIQEFIDSVTEEDEHILQECTGLNFNEIRNMDLDLCCVDEEYRNKCVAIQEKFLRTVREYLEKELWK